MNLTKQLLYCGEIRLPFLERPELFSRALTIRDHKRTMTIFFVLHVIVMSWSRMVNIPMLCCVHLSVKK